MKVIALINAAAGSAAGGDRLADAGEALRAAGLEPDIRPVQGADLERAAADAAAQNPHVLVAGGGDGTVSSAAGAIAGTGIPLGILPFGTLNHFSQDLGIPPRPEHAARLIADTLRATSGGSTAGGAPGRVREVDVGEVNGRVFLNNASIGLYPHIVSNRQRQQDRLGRNKWVAMVVAFVSVFRRYPVVKVVVDTGDAALPRTTPFVFVGNNRYEMSGFAAGSRAQLDAGALSLYLAHRTGRFGLLLLALRMLVGRLHQASEFEWMDLQAFRVETPKKTLKMALDGEVVRLVPPLEFRVRPRALRVVAP
jgi:diacylglycerol kinase family enzyme